MPRLCDGCARRCSGLSHLRIRISKATFIGENWYLDSHFSAFVLVFFLSSPDKNALYLKHEPMVALRVKSV